MAVNVEPYVFLRVVVGSHAFGLATETSDEDRRGIYLPSADWHWSLAKPPEQVESIIDGIDVVDWEIEKFLTQALKGNPTILETLWSPIVLHSDALGDELAEVRDAPVGPVPDPPPVFPIMLHTTFVAAGGSRPPPGRSRRW